MPGNPLSDPNWAAEVADTVERTVVNVREKTTDNVALAARGVVFGLLLGFLGLAAGLLLLIGLTRVLQDVAFDPWLTRDRAVYLSYFVVGGMLLLLGWFLMRKRFTKS